ncbi:unnamed protein product [Lota lota]
MRVSRTQCLCGGTRWALGVEQTQVRNTCTVFRPLQKTSDLHRSDSNQSFSLAPSHQAQAASLISPVKGSVSSRLKSEAGCSGGCGSRWL